MKPMPELTPAAKSALMSTGTSRVGAKPTHRVPWGITAELMNDGLIGSGGGLTVAGANVRERLSADIPF